MKRYIVFYQDSIGDQWHCEIEIPHFMFGCGADAIVQFMEQEVYNRTCCSSFKITGTMEVSE